MEAGGVVVIATGLRAGLWTHINMLRLRMGSAVPQLLCPVEGQLDFVPK